MLTNKQSFIFGFVLCLLLVGTGVGATVLYYMNVRITGIKMPSNYTPKEIGVILGEISGIGVMFGKDNATEIRVSLPPLQENNTMVSKEYHIANSEHINKIVVFDSIYNIPEGANVTIVCKMNDPWNVEDRVPYLAGTSTTIKPGETLYFWVILEDEGMDEGEYTITMKFHLG